MAQQAMREAMRPDRALIDKDFDRYVLGGGSGVTRTRAPLSVPALEPLAAGRALRKAQWEARARHNALASDPFRSAARGDRPVAYLVNANFELVQVAESAAGGLETRRLFTFPISSGRQENASLLVAGRGRVVYGDGLGSVLFLRAAQPDTHESAWSCEYECAPLGAVPAVLLAAVFDEQAQRFRLLAAEPVVDQPDSDAAFRLSAIDVFAAKPGLDGASGVGFTHSATDLALVPALPSYVSLVGDRLVVLLEGAFQLLMKARAGETVTAATAATTATAATAAGSPPHKRPHNDDDLDDDEMAELLSKFPRAGIGYHGDISGVKSPRALASALDLSVPLEARFQRSSEPFSSVADEPMASASASTASPTSGGAGGAARSPQTRPLEIPTTESILGGLEECDDRDPFAKATLLLVDLSQQLVAEQVEVDCKEYRFLCSSARVAEPSGDSDAANDALRQSLLFRNDVHALLYDLDVSSDGKLALRHSATLPAFGFVQASKQEKKFMSTLPSAAFAVIGEFDKRLFVYLGTAATASERAQHVRRQFVVELGDEPLLGMQIVSRDTVLVLTPRSVYAVKVPVDSD